MTLRLIDKIMQHEILQQEPPVLLDVGASGSAHCPWQRIARYAHCVAFDGDCRDMAHIKQTARRYRSFNAFASIVCEEPATSRPFFLTRSPACSSLLPPDHDSLAPWLFSPFFEVVETTQSPVMTITQALDSAGFSKVDWFKADSQGTDLRLFRSLGEEYISRVLVAEFEPGIIDAYLGEDKLHQVLCFMETQPFWLAAINVKGTSRLHKRELMRYRGGLSSRLAAHLLPHAPCWAELAYLRNEKACIDLGLRETLLACVFALMYRHYGAAHYIAVKGYEEFRDPLLEQAATRCDKRLGLGPWNVVTAGLRAAVELMRTKLSRQ